MSKEQEEHDEALREIRINEQKKNKDYDYDEDGNIEVCHDCGTPLNSHGHCPRCDY